MKPTERELGLVVLGAGHVLLRTDDGLSSAKTFEREHGGEAAMAAMHCASAGVDTALVTRVGDDPFSSWLVETWDGAGIHLDYVRHSAGRNILSLRSDRADSMGSVVWRDGSAPTGLAPADLDGVPWDLTRVVYASGATQALGSRPAETVLAAFGSARRAGALTVFRPALRDAHWSSASVLTARSAFDAVLPMTDVLLMEAPFEAGRMLDQPSAELALDEIHRRGVSRALLSVASRGLYVMDQEVRTSLEAPNHQDLDRLVGPILAALTQGVDLRQAVEQCVGDADGQDQ
jgi:2-dehydro-3-deoxygluconokinase